MFCQTVGSINLFDAPKDKPRVGLFAGAACLKKFVATHAPRKIGLGTLGAIQSGSPPVAPVRGPFAPGGPFAPSPLRIVVLIAITTWGQIARSLGTHY
jgi:hypothetical protein